MASYHVPYEKIDSVQELWTKVSHGTRCETEASDSPEAEAWTVLPRWLREENHYAHGDIRELSKRPISYKRKVPKTLARVPWY